jgi:hypothetical protein
MLEEQNTLHWWSVMKSMNGFKGLVFSDTAFGLNCRNSSAGLVIGRQGEEHNRRRPVASSFVPR